MGQRKVYIDFVDGNGYIDISDFVKYDTLSIQETSFNDTFHAAQNTCSFSVIYDASIYTKITTNTKNLPLRIIDLREEAALHTEADQPIFTENGVRLLIETSVAVPVFAGHIPPKSSRDYNGILDNTIIKINATDNLDYFDMPVGDVLYANCAVMNPSDPANSIVHKLALIAGWTATMVSTAAIPTVIARYSPSDEKATVRSILDTLLYEYGYTLFLNENGDLAPIQWDRSIPSGTILEFNEDNIIDEISIENSTQKYDGVKVVYYDLNSVNDVRLYRDSNCGYASDGSFAGFAILDNTDYPPTANAIDETTGNKQIVYQEYTDNAIKYATNKAIQQNLDYNYKNYDSDFTSIVATENHYVDRRFQSPITVVTEAFANKKCRLLYRNTTGSPVLLYYNDVYSTIWYKSAEHTAIKNIATTPSDVYEYTSSYIFNKAVGDELALAIAAQYKNGLRTYEHTSEKDYHCGDIVRIVLSGEGTNTYALVQNKAWDEKDQLYTYSCMSYNPTRETLTSQTVVEVGAINSAESYASIHSIGTPEAVSGAISAVQLALEDQIDGKIACFYQNDAPVSTVNYTLCEGDLWFDTNDGNNQYRYNGTNWIDVQDTGIAAAYNLANSKNTIFATLALAQDSAVIGDLFLDSSLMYRCTVAGGAITLANSTRLTIKNFGRLATAPSSGMIANDTYYNTTNETSYYYDGNAWIASATSGATVVTTYTPKYLGMYLDSAPASFNTGDWYTRYSATSGITYRGVFVRGVSSWARTEDSRYLGNGAINDILKITTNPVVMTSSSAPSGTWVNELGLFGTQMYIWNGATWDAIAAISYGAVSDYGATYYENLFSRFIKILTGGSIYGGDRFDSTGAEVNVSKNGFYLGANGKLKANLQSLFNDNVMVGTGAGLYLQNSGGDSSYNTIVGTGAGYGSPSSIYYSCSFFGYYSGFSSTTGSANSFFGDASGYNCTTGNANSFFGFSAGCNVAESIGNSYFGFHAGYNSVSGDNNSMFGSNAGYNNISGRINSFFGYRAGATSTTEYNCTCLGNEAQITGPNQVQLGNSATTTYVYGTVQNRSDMRDKTGIKPEPLGLSFINKLNPVQFQWDFREDYLIVNKGNTITELPKDGSKKRNRYHNGFLAQDVKAVMDELDIDFGGYQDHSINGGKDVLSLGYDEFIAPICKAIQELSTEVGVLKETINGKCKD